MELQPLRAALLALLASMECTGTRTPKIPRLGPGSFRAGGKIPAERDIVSATRRLSLLSISTSVMSTYTPYTGSEPIYLVFGAKGWIGGMLGEMLKAQGKNVVLSKARIEDRASVLACVPSYSNPGL